VAVFAGIMAGFYVELMNAKSRDSARRFPDDLEGLPEISKEELEELAERSRRFARERMKNHPCTQNFIEYRQMAHLQTDDLTLTEGPNYTMDVSSRYIYSKHDFSIPESDMVFLNKTELANCILIIVFGLAIAIWLSFYDVDLNDMEIAFSLLLLASSFIIVWKITGMNFLKGKSRIEDISLMLVLIVIVLFPAEGIVISLY